MGNFNFLPDRDWRNDGWTLSGSAVTKVYEALNNDDDTKFITNPASKGVAAIQFPVDTASVPEGAVITSVSVFARLAKVGSTSRSCTFQVSCDDDEGRIVTRTVHDLSTTPTTVEVATYTRDARGLAWDVQRLNKVIVRTFSYVSVAISVRIYKLYIRINYRVRPTVTVTAPTGTVLTPSPTIAWTYAQADGDPQKKVEYKVYTAAQVGRPNFSPDRTVATFHQVLNGDVSSHVIPTSLNPDQYYVYVRAYSSFGAKSRWANKQFTVAGPSPAPPGNDNAGVAGTPGVGVITVIPDSFRSSASLTMRDASNLLSVQQADFETTSDALEYTTSNCAVARDTSDHFGEGVASMSLTASSAADMSATSGFVEVAPSAPYTIVSQFKAATTGRTVRVKALFFDEAFASTGSTVTGTGTDESSTWTEVTATGTTPAAAAYVKVTLEVASPANAEVHRVDHVGFMYGAGSAWSHGGHMSRNLLDAYSATGDDPSNSTYGWIAGNIACSVSRPAASGTGSHGSLTNRLTYNGVSPTIAARGAGTTFNSVTSGTDFTLNKPASTVSGDLMLAFVTSSERGTITPPAGWTTVSTTSLDDGSTDVALWVLKRTAGGSEPASWTDGVLGTTSLRRAAVVASYGGAADAADQMIAEGGRTDAAGALVHTTATVSNTDSNAWRISAFAVRDNVTGGAMTANRQPPTSPLPISFVGVASTWSTTSPTSSFTINKPSGVQSGDLMLATVGVGDTSTCTFTPPSGWTLVRQTSQSDSVASSSLAVMRRIAGSSEPSSWAGTLSGSRSPVLTQAQAYRNVHATTPILVDNTSVSGSGTSITTASVSNTSSSAWRVCSFAFTDPDLSTATTTEVVERKDSSAHKLISGVSNDRTITVLTADSNTSVSTGAHSRVGTLGESYYAAASWIGFLKPVDAPAVVADETQRADFNVGTSDPVITTAVFDSGGVVPAGSTSVSGVFTPGSGTSADGVASWVGIIRPATAATEGTVQAKLNAKIDIEDIDPIVLSLASNKVTFTSSFKGSTGGTPYLKLSFYRANELLLESIEEGTPFESSIWKKSSATFDVPAGTTRILPEVSATDRSVADTVDFDRTSVALGDSLVWRNGTGRDAHPVWSIPDIQYADDDGTGYGEWKTLPGLAVNPPHFDPLTGSLVYEDHTMVPLNNRKYRAQTISYGLAGDRFASGYGPESEQVTLEAANWWLKDITDPDSNMQLKVRRELSIGTTNTSSVFQPLGADFPVVVTEGYKGDSMSVTVLVTREEYVQLRQLLNRGKTLYLQNDMDNAWWVRPVGELEASLLDTGQRQANPLRWVSVSFVQVQPEL